MSEIKSENKIISNYQKENLTPSHSIELPQLFPPHSPEFQRLIDSLLCIVDTHEEDCSDYNPINKGTCTRCTLISMRNEDKWNEDYDIKILLIKKRVN